MNDNTTQRRYGQVSVILRLLALLGVLWTGKQVAKQVVTVFSPQQPVDQEGQEGEIGDEMVKDPVCQTFIPKSLAIKKTIHGETVFFCSEECALNFSKHDSSDT